ncbi:hypothetical protein CGK18_23810, partial [Vibrio parahaemolyticus]
MAELIILLSLVCLVFLFTKKGKKHKRRLNEWDQGAAAKRSNNVHAFDTKVIDRHPKLVEVPIPQTKVIESNKPSSVPHRKNTYLATKTERKFYKVLQELLPDEYVIHSQV